jgi:dipeptidyl-peptidase III
MQKNLLLNNMKLKTILFSALAYTAVFTSCSDANQETKEPISEIKSDSTDFKWQTEQFADIKIIRYQIPGFDKLSLSQKKLVYYLTQAGYSGRDIMYDQNYQHNLKIRKALEKIVSNYKGDKNTPDWAKFMEYSKRFWFSNGIHHHYSNAKILPEFSKEYFTTLMQDAGATLPENAIVAIFDASIDNKKVNLDDKKGDLLLNSAVNFYAPEVSAIDVENFYKKMRNTKTSNPLAYGINSRLVKNADGTISEQVWKVGGLYGTAIEKIVYWLEKASTVAENEKQKKALDLLITYYKTGDLKTWDEYNIEWVSATDGDVDYINGFIEVYQDPLGYRGSYESVVQIKDFDASERMKVVAENAKYFEQNSPIMEQHKKKEVQGISYKVVSVAGEAGDASPSTPIGVNLPNSNWIRAAHGSKSVSLGNITEAYEKAGGKGMLQEFANDAEEIERSEKFSSISDKMHTALHEVIGHASGKLESGVSEDALKNYGSTLEEGRADLVALYYILDQKLVDLGLVESLEVGKAEYDGYIRNGLMVQLRRLKVGEDIEESHMRNRHWVSAWVLEKGTKDSVVVVSKRDGKTFFDIKDYSKLRVLFGDLLKEVQRIKSQGDFNAAKLLVENYGVKVNPILHKEVLTRAEKLSIAPYGGFINPKLVPVIDNKGEITDIKVEYPADFVEQMLFYGKEFSFLTEENAVTVKSEKDKEHDDD